MASGPGEGQVQATHAADPPGSGVEGAVTLLFSEIDDATALWEHHPDGMRRAVPQYRELLARVVTSHGGRPIHQLGDSMHAVFATAANAVRCAAEIRSELLRHPWPLTGKLRARIALHTGVLECGPSELFGPEVTVATRLHGAANGGQVLLSEATRRACGGVLPAGEVLRKLGHHPLPGLDHDVTVYALVPGRDASQPEPLRLEPSGYEDVPQERNRLIGRERMVSDVLQLVRDERLVTLWGPGGVGKTRVAARVAARSSSPFEDGVRFVDLSVVQAADQVPQVALSALRASTEKGEDAADAVVRVLVPERVLLILDGAEHVLVRVRDLVTSILERCPWVHVLVTSREQLRMAAEHLVEVLPLDLPPHDGDPGTIGASPAVRLFVDRARMADGAFSLTSDNVALVADICRRVGGLPLAIELAAGRLDVETPHELAGRSAEARVLTRLENRGSPGDPSGSVAGSLAWSYDLLTPPEQHLFLSLGVFAGTFTREMGLTVSGVNEEPEQDRAFDRLVRSSMITRDRPGSGRFRLFEPAREFARGRLDRAELEDLRHRHAALMLARAERFGPRIRTDEEAEACEVLRDDFAEHRQAASWFFDHGQVEEAARHVVALYQFCHFQLLAEGYEWARRLAAILSDRSPLAVEVWGAAALGAWFEGDISEAVRLGERAAALAEPLGDGGAYWALLALIDSFGYTGRVRDGADYFLRFAAACAGSDDAFWRITGLGYEAITLLMFGRSDRALQRAEEAAGLARQLNNPDCTHWALHCLGRALADEDPEAACQAFEEAIDATRRIGSRWNLALDLGEWAALRRQLGDHRSAARGLLELLELLGGAGNRSQLAQTFLDAARLLMDQGAAETAFVLFEARRGMPEMAKGSRAAAVDEEFRASLERAVGGARSRLAVRARGLSEQDLIILCRSSLEDIANGRIPSRPGRTRRFEDVTIVYTDLVASTELNVRLGDAGFLDVLREHNAVVRRRLGRFGGREFTFTGDGIGAVFPDMSEAMRFSVGLPTDLGEVSAGHPGSFLRVRVGMARGEALENEGNLFGQTVLRAVRVCGAADPGQVLLGEDVAATADAAIARLRPTGSVALKGFGTSVLLYEAQEVTAAPDMGRRGGP